ncbi:hypothetical protein V2G26_009034 [Clonostachys chloroleuca]
MGAASQEQVGLLVAWRKRSGAGTEGIYCRFVSWMVRNEGCHRRLGRCVGSTSSNRLELPTHQQSSIWQMTVRGDGDDGPNDAMLLQAGRRAPSHMLAPPSGSSGGEVSRGELGDEAEGVFANNPSGFTCI